MTRSIKNITRPLHSQYNYNVNEKSIKRRFLDFLLFVLQLLCSNPTSMRKQNREKQRNSLMKKKSSINLLYLYIFPWRKHGPSCEQTWNPFTKDDLYKVRFDWSWLSGSGQICQCIFSFSLSSLLRERCCP
jgi:hypothetical protein